MKNWRQLRVFLRLKWCQFTQRSSCWVVRKRSLYLSQIITNLIIYSSSQRMSSRCTWHHQLCAAIPVIQTPMVARIALELEQMALTRAAEKIKACLLLTVTKYWTWMSRAWSFSHQTFLIRIVTNLTQLRPMLRHLSQEMSFHRSTATQPQHPTLQASTRHFICTSDYLLASVYASIRVHSSVEMTQSTRRKNTKMWLIRRTQMPLKKTPIVMKMTRKTQKIRDKKNLIRTRNSKLKSWTSSFLKKSWLPCKSLAQTCGHKTSKPATKCLKTHNQEEKVTKVKWMISNQVSRLA